MFADFSNVVDKFIQNLRDLADTIETNNDIVDAKRTAAQARVAAQLLEYANAFEGPPSPPWDTSTAEEKAEWAKRYNEEEDKAWSDAWAYVGANIRRWWD